MTSELRSDNANNHNKEYSIIVNGREKTINEKLLSFNELISLAGFSFVPNERTIYTVTYKKGDNQKPEGSMVDGDSVKVKNGMLFNVTATDKS